MYPHWGTIIFHSKMQESEKTILEKPEIKSYQFIFKSKPDLSVPLDPYVTSNCSVQRIVKKKKKSRTLFSCPFNAQIFIEQVLTVWHCAQQRRFSDALTASVRAYVQPPA